MSVSKLNCDLVRALGVDLDRVTRLVLVVQPGKLPTIHVTRLLDTADGLEEAVQRLRLRPEPDREPAAAGGD